jgi:hypothetical protein
MRRDEFRWRDCATSITCTLIRRIQPLQGFEVELDVRPRYIIVVEPDEHNWLDGMRSVLEQAARACMSIHRGGHPMENPRKYVGQYEGMSVYVDPMAPPDVIYNLRSTLPGVDRILVMHPSRWQQIQGAVR